MRTIMYNYIRDSAELRGLYEKNISTCDLYFNAVDFVFLRYIRRT